MPSGLRQQAGQLSWFAREMADADTRRRVKAARSGIHLPTLPPSRRRSGEVWGVTMVRNEQDIVGQCLRHLLGQGVDHLLVADNLSDDDTPAILAELAASDRRVHLARDIEPAYFQAEKMTYLARAAQRAGADWIVPFDADEFWFAEVGSLGEFFARATADPSTPQTIRALIHDTIPTGSSTVAPTRATYIMDSTPTPPGKVAYRAHRLAMLMMGNHGVKRVGGIGGGLRIGHLLYRSPEQIARKARQGAEAVARAEGPDYVGAHWRALDALDREHIEEVWSQIQRGEPRHDLFYWAIGPMVRTTPLQWYTWDPDKELGEGRPDLVPR